MSNQNIIDLAEMFKKEVAVLDRATLQIIVNNRTTAIEYVKKGVITSKLDQSLTEDQIEATANEMQAVAKMELENRSGN
jgi:hypothetical protein